MLFIESVVLESMFLEIADSLIYLLIRLVISMELVDRIEAVINLFFVVIVRLLLGLDLYGYYTHY